MIGERRRQVDDDPVVRDAQQVDDLAQVGRGDQVGALRRGGREQHPDPGRVVDHDRLEQVGVRLPALDRVEDGAVLGVQVEEDTDVAELEVGVDEADPTAGLRHESQRQVGGNGRPAGSTLRAEDGHHLVVLLG